jgi:hypothetical protein
MTPSCDINIQGHMTSTKNSHGFPIAILKDCLLPLTSGGILTRLLLGSIPGCLALTTLAVSESLPLLAGDFFCDLSFRLLLPEALLPV